MTFALAPDEPISAGLERIAREEAAAALAALDPAGGDVDDEAIHEARKRGKRIRAVVRLAREGLPTKRRKKLDRRVRDAGRELAPLRDARVLLDTLDGFADGGGAPLSAEALAPVRELLEEREAAARRRVLDAPVLGAAAGGFAAVVDSRPWDLDLDAEDLRAGLARSASRAARAYRKAGASPDAGRLHAWRKRVKDLRHQVEVLTPLWTPVLEPLGTELHRLSDLLGDRHDLDVLLGVLDGAGERLGGVDLLAIRDVGVHRGEEFAAAAFSLGPKVHAEDADAFADRVTAYATAWPAGW